MRLIIAGVLGGVVMFLWSFFSHTVLPIGDTGVRKLPNEAAVLSSLKQHIPEPGLYFYPGMDMSHGDVSAEEQAAWAERYKAGPRGILVFQPTGEEPMGVKNLASELFSNILASLLAALALSWLPFSTGRRVLLGALFGLVGWLSIDVSLWNWYGFPTAYLLAQGIDQTVGWTLAGAAIAFVIRPRETVI